MMLYIEIESWKGMLSLDVQILVVMYSIISYNSLSMYLVIYNILNYFLLCVIDDRRIPATLSSTNCSSLMFACAVVWHCVLPYFYMFFLSFCKPRQCTRLHRNRSPNKAKLSQNYLISQAYGIVQNITHPSPLGPPV